MKTCFYAYSSNPAISFHIHHAIELIGDANKEVKLISWQDNPATGQFIIQKVCKEIDECDVFICDLTDINLNVLFELGYAMFMQKKLWITLNTDFYDKEKFSQTLGFLTSIGYVTYENADQLRDKFIADAPYKDLLTTFYSSAIHNIVTQIPLGEPSLCYLKSPQPTGASQELTALLSKLSWPLVTDNPQEVRNRPLAWYIENVERSFGIVAHFVDEKNEQKYPQNARYALVCGMAHARGKPFLMLAHSVYKPAVDYRDFMFVHNTPKECNKITTEWLEKNSGKFEDNTKIYSNRQRYFRATENLQRVKLGEYVAEDEKEILGQYFIKTAIFSQALKTSQYMVYVGRKGSETV
jgi:hypothetical protein